MNGRTVDELRMMRRDILVLVEVMRDFHGCRCEVQPDIQIHHRDGVVCCIQLFSVLPLINFMVSHKLYGYDSPVD